MRSPRRSGAGAVCCGECGESEASLVAADPGDACTATGDVSSDPGEAVAVSGVDRAASGDVRGVPGDVGDVSGVAVTDLDGVPSTYRSAGASDVGGSHAGEPAGSTRSVISGRSGRRKRLFRQDTRPDGVRIRKLRRCRLTPLMTPVQFQWPVRGSWISTCWPSCRGRCERAEAS